MHADILKQNFVMNMRISQWKFHCSGGFMAQWSSLRRLTVPVQYLHLLCFYSGKATSLDTRGSAWHVALKKSFEMGLSHT